jgi:hypothetical protein
MRIGSYLLLAPMGAGGMGEVWKARDSRIDQSHHGCTLNVLVAATALE